MPKCLGVAWVGPAIGSGIGHFQKSRDSGCICGGAAEHPRSVIFMERTCGDNARSAPAIPAPPAYSGFVLHYFPVRINCFRSDAPLAGEAMAVAPHDLSTSRRPPPPRSVVLLAKTSRPRAGFGDPRLCLKDFRGRRDPAGDRAGQRVLAKTASRRPWANAQALLDENTGLELHLLGPLQSNKAHEAIEIIDVIEGVDREKIAVALAKEIKSLNARDAAENRLPLFLIPRSARQNFMCR